jgi:hypothetical protein
MLIGTASLDALATRAAAMQTLDPAPLVLDEAEVLQVSYEIASADREAMLPPALHPTDPALVTWLVYRCPASPWGSFTMAQTRIECRSGLRLRAFLVAAVVDNPAAAAALGAQWGYATRAGEVALHRWYDTIRAVVHTGGAEVLDVVVSDPDPLAAGDLQYVANMNLAHTPRGLRLVQVEPRYDVRRAERGRPRVLAFDGAAWGEARIRPTHPIAASLALASITFAPVRFLCRPEVWAFAGTETV